ncbi:MAG: hypothetical protein ACI9TV_002690, partial [Sulfurimonas sp.]
LHPENAKIINMLDKNNLILFLVCKISSYPHSYSV